MFTKRVTLPHKLLSCQLRWNELIACFSSGVIMFPLYSPCRNCIISILFPSNPLRGLWGRKVLNEAFRWWEKQQTSKWQLPMMHSHWAKQRCSCMQQILLWSTAHLFNLLFKRERGCKFNPERSSVCLIWTDTLVFFLIGNHGKLLMRSDRLSCVSNSWWNM